MFTIPGLRKRRNTVNKSIARLVRRIASLEGKPIEPTAFDVAQEIAKALSEHDREFKDFHYQLLDLIDESDEGALEKEQKELDDHDDVMDDVKVRIKQLLASSLASVNSPKRKAIARRQLWLENAVTSIRDIVRPFTTESDSHLVRQYDDRLQVHKLELKALADDLMNLDLESSDDLLTTQHRLDDFFFECELIIRKLIGTETSPLTASSSDADHRGVKLPKLSAPTFDGKLTSWTSFWEQFNVAIHSRTTLSDVEKLAYLRNSLKEGTAKGIIEGLSMSGDHYAEAIKTLKARYDRPRLIHQSHVRAILDAPGLKEGTGREIRKLHDVAQQHLRALKSMGFEPSGPFITSVLELKLDSSTSFEWQKASQEISGVPHYTELLDFLNLRAHATEASANDARKNTTRLEDHSKKGGNRQITSFATNTTELTPPSCCLCKTEKHFLFACPQLKALPHHQRMATVKSNDLCVNCLRPGHFVKQCRS